MPAIAQQNPHTLWFTVIDIGLQTTAIFHIHDYFAYNQSQRKKCYDPPMYFQHQRPYDITASSMFVSPQLPF